MPDPDVLGRSLSNRTFNEWVAYFTLEHQDEAAAYTRARR